MKLPHPGLWNAIQDGYQFVTVRGDKVRMKTSDIGGLVLPTGRIVTSDPLLDPWNRPYSIAVSSGCYPVHIALAEDNVALIMVLFGEGTPTMWKAGKPKRCNVDSATCCVMDAKVNRFLRRKSLDDKYDRYMTTFEDSLVENGDRWANVCLHEKSGANLFIFRTWGGDGSFPAFFGYNQQNEPVCLVIDFFLENLVEDGES